MTTSEPQADPRRDDDREHRTIGQRIRDAVLGEPEEGAGAGPAGTTTGGGHGDPGREASGYAESSRDADRDAGYADPTSGGVADRRDPGYADAAASGHGASAPAFGAGSAGTDRAAGYADPADTPAHPARGDTGYGDADRGYASSGGQAHLADPAVPDPVRDDVTQDGAPRSVDRDRTGPGYADDARGAATQDRDLVTSSYDPDRDAGYDPQAAGTAMAAPTGERVDGGADQDVRPGHADRDTRDYDPAADAGYVDERRGDVDATTGHRDTDYDTGRVDTRPGSADRTTGAGAAGAVAAGGAAAAAGVAAGHHRDRDDRDPDDRGGDDRGAGFSGVDDTSTVDATSTGRATQDRVDAAGTAGTAGDAASDRAEAVADEAHEADGSDRRERLVPAERAEAYSSRWDALKGDFVDEPRRAVAQADDLVGELLDEIQRLFADQRRDLEQGFDHDRASTEDLRLALRRYRSFFDRLLSF
jgi:hypothetical protein